MVISARFDSICSVCHCQIKSGESIDWQRGQKARHATLAQCNAAKAAAPASPKMDRNELTKLIDFLNDAVKRGLKHPKVRFLGVDGATEVRLSLTTRGQAPGSLAVVSNGNYYGAVRPDGTVTGPLSSDKDMQKRLIRIAEDPIAAAREYAALMCNCSFCGKELTDAGSVQVGYGPICAKHFGLPHTPLGTSIIGQVHA